MASPEDFIRDYLKERVHLQELWNQAWLPVRERYFDPGYDAFHPERNLDLAKSEVPLETSESNGTAVVTTSGYGEGHRLRYTLQDWKGSWRICGIHLECSLCRGTGKYKTGACRLCKGKGWKQF